MKEKIPVHTYTYLYACAAMRKVKGSKRHPLNKVAWPCSGEEMPRQQVATHHWGSAAAATQPAVCLFPLIHPLSLHFIPATAVQPENSSSGLKNDKMHEGKYKTKKSQQTTFQECIGAKFHS